MLRTTRSAADYQTHTHLDHIRAKPSSYIGDVSPVERQEWIWAAGRMVYANLSVPEGMVRLYLEAISNAGDNTFASRIMGVHPGRIDVRMDAKTIIVRSGGAPIPVVPDPEHGALPDKIFGQLLTSSHYDEKVIRMGCGTNGYGAKLCNIFSTRFQVTVGDPQNGQEHAAVWMDGMKRKVSSTTRPGWVPGASRAPGAPYTGPAYVEVSFDVDFAYFGIDPRVGWSAEVIGLFTRFIIDFGLTCKVLVSFNGVEYDVRSLRDYARLYWPADVCDTAVIHYEWANEVAAAECKRGGKAWEKKISCSEGITYIPTTEICILDTPDSASCLSFLPRGRCGRPFDAEFQ
jgi:DNA topoisomerase II